MLLTHREIAEEETVSFEDLRALAAAAKNPCITVALAIPNPAQIRPRINNTIHEVEKGLKERGIDATEDLIEPIQALAARIEERGEWSKALVLFRSSAIFRYFSMPELEKQFATVEDRFQIRPLLPVLSRYQRFYLLGLSLKHVRLFHCTYHHAEELKWRGLAPQSLHAWMNSRQPDHALDNRAAVGPSVGSMKGVMFGTNTDHERQDGYVMHFFKEVDKGVEKILMDKSIPLTLAGVESEIAIYRRINTYPQLMERAVHGSPDGIAPGELHERALKVVKQVFSTTLKKALDEVERYRGTSRVSAKIDEILKAAVEGRVLDLILREDAECRGVWDDSAEPAPTRRNNRQEDLLNRAALETALRRGQVFALKASEIPGRADAVAVLRF